MMKYRYITRPKFLVLLSFWFKKFPDSIPEPEFDLEWFLFVLLFLILNLQLYKPVSTLYCTGSIIIKKTGKPHSRPNPAQEIL